MGDEQRLSPDELIAQARAQFEAATDFTSRSRRSSRSSIPDSLDLTNRFEEVQAAARGTALEAHLVGELIASEVEVRTGRQESFADIPAVLAERRAQLRSLVEPMGLLLGATGTHPWADWKEQRIIDTPHYRRNDELLRYVVWRNNTFGLHVHVAINGPDRAIAVMAGMRNFLPELLALSASSPFVEGVSSGLHSARTQIFTRFFPRCGVPDAFASWDEYEQLRPVPLRHRLDHRAHAAVVERSPAPRLPHGRDPDLRRPAGAARGRFARRLRGFARRSRSRAPTTRATPSSRFRTATSRRTSGAPSATASPASSSTSREDGPSRRSSGSRSSIAWVLPAAEEIDAAPFLAVPEQNAAERQIERFEGGASLEEIYAEQVRATETIGG